MSSRIDGGPLGVYPDGWQSLQTRREGWFIVKLKQSNCYKQQTDAPHPLSVEGLNENETALEAEANKCVEEGWEKRKAGRLVIVAGSLPS